MPYYPKSQIKTNLYTNGDQYSLKVPSLKYLQPPYIGPYYLLYNGKAYTGKNPANPPNYTLYPLINIENFVNNLIGDDIELFDAVKLDIFQFSKNNEEIINYTNILSKNSIPFKRLLPYYIPTIPTQKDYLLGSFLRYFCKKNNELKYIEIDQKQYQLFSSKSRKVAWDLYTPISTLWYLTGNESNVAKFNKELISTIERNQNWFNFTQYFQKDFSKYYQSQDINNLYTTGGEFTTKNGQNYIGFYHIHNSTTPMAGKTHINAPHDVLTPIKKSQPITQTTSSVMLPITLNISSGGGSYSGGGSSMGGGGSY